MDGSAGLCVSIPSNDSIKADTFREKFIFVALRWKISGAVLALYFIQ